MTPRRFQRWTENELDQLRVLARRHIRAPAIARVLWQKHQLRPHQSIG
jgi:hypothetical protein